MLINKTKIRMIEEIRCEICDRTFKDEDGLSAHNKAKHPERIPKERKPLPVKRIRNWIIFLLIIGLVIYGFIYLFSWGQACKDIPVTEMNLKGHQNLRMHIHPTIKIILDRVPRQIPANIGIFPGIMRPIHTHDSTGVLHIESPCLREFYLSEFFDVWEELFNENQIFEKTTDEGELKMYVNNVENNEFGNYIMRDGDEILIEYISKKN